jgi:hypothetical protein
VLIFPSGTIGIVVDEEPSEEEESAPEADVQKVKPNERESETEPEETKEEPKPFVRIPVDVVETHQGTHFVVDAPGTDREAMKVEVGNRRSLCKPAFWFCPSFSMLCLVTYSSSFFLFYDLIQSDKGTFFMVDCPRVRPGGHESRGGVPSKRTCKPLFSFPISFSELYLVPNYFSSSSLFTESFSEDSLWIPKGSTGGDKSQRQFAGGSAKTNAYFCSP